MVFSLFVLIGNPLIVLAIMALMRYPVKVGFLAGLTVAQISEFSLILAALGLSLGHITNATVSLITVVGLMTIGGSTYLILYSHQIYARIGRFLTVFDRTGKRGVDTTDYASSSQAVDVILYGLGRFGSHVARCLSLAGYRVLAVDYDPNRVGAEHPGSVTAVFGSAEDMYFLETLPLSHVRCVISTIPTLDTNLALLHGLRQHGYTGRIAPTAFTAHDAEQLLAAGGNTVLEPFALAAEASAAKFADLIDAVEAEQDVVGRDSPASTPSPATPPISGHIDAGRVDRRAADGTGDDD